MKRTMTILDRQTGEPVHFIAYNDYEIAPADLFEWYARKEGLPGVDGSLPMDAMRTELYNAYEYRISKPGEQS